MTVTVLLKVVPNLLSVRFLASSSSVLKVVSGKVTWDLHGGRVDRRPELTTTTETTGTFESQRCHIPVFALKVLGDEEI